MYADIDDIHAVHLCQIIIYVQAFYFVSKKIVISYHDKVVMFIRFSQDISQHSINVSWPVSGCSRSQSFPGGDGTNAYS